MNPIKVRRLAQLVINRHANSTDHADSYWLITELRSPLHSPIYSSWNLVIPASPIGISGILLIFFTMYFTLYRTILNGIVAYPAGGVTRI
jgi:hypothetical protein